MRRIVKIIIVLVVLAAAVAGGGTLLLRSDWLGRKVLAVASERLGLDVRADSFSVGWGGDARLGMVSVRMPLTEEVVFRADRVELGLGAVPLLVLARSIRVHAVQLDRPTVFLRQAENGRWNAEDIWAQVQASLPPGAQQDRDVQLPQITVRDAEVRITDSGGTTQTAGPIGFDARPKGPVLWTFDLRVSSLGGLTGQVVEGPDWGHDIRFDVKNLGSLVQSLLRQNVAPIRLVGRWKGSVARDTVTGAIELDECVLAGMALRGGARIEATKDQVTVSPRNLIVSEPNLGGEPIRITDGAATISPARVTLVALAAQAGAFGGRIDGGWDLVAGAGEFSGSWASAEPNHSLQSSGTYRLTAKSPPEGRKEVRADVTVQTRTPVGTWQGVAHVQGGGANWQRSQWQIEVPTFAWARGESLVEVADTAGRIELQWPEIRLTSLSVPAARQVKADVQVDARTRHWSARLAVEQWHGLSAGASGVDLQLTAAGDGREARVSDLRLASDDKVVTAKGGLVLARGELQDVQLSAEWPAGGMAAGGGSLPPGATGPRPPAGRWRFEGAVTGKVLPVALEAQATLAGQNILVGKRLVDRVQIPVQASVGPQQIEANTPPFSLFGGQWQLSGRYEFPQQATVIQVMVSDLSLAAVASLAGLPLPAGGTPMVDSTPETASQGRAQAAIKLQMPGVDIQKAVAVGGWTAQDIKISPLTAERAQGILRISGGSARLEDIQLQQGEGLVRAGLEFQLDKPQVLSIELDAENWPVQWEPRPVALVVNGKAKLQTNIVKKTADGDASLTSRILWQDKDLANLQLSAHVQEQTIEVRELHADTLNGSAEGIATIPVSHWVDSVARLRWQGIQPRQLQAWLPSMERFQGTLSGSLTVEQTAVTGGKAAGSEGGQPPRDTGPATAGPELPPLGPLRLVLDANLAEGRFGAAEIGASRITGYLDPNRLLIEKADLNVLGGRLETRVRVSRHAGQYYGAVVADFNNLDLNQLVHAIDPNAGQSIGRLSGRATVLPAFDDRLSLAGEGRINLTQSDLVDSRVVGTLYNTLSLHFGEQKPTGTGEIRVSLEGPAVVLSSMQYFNRGIEIRGSAKILNVNLGADSPIEGYAVASTQILKGLKLPGVKALDRLLDVLQTGAVSAKIGGVVDNMEVKVVPLPEVLGPFRRLLWAQLRE